MTNTEKNKDNRKKNLIDPKLQYQIMKIMIAGAAAVCVVFLMGFYYFMSSIFDLLNNIESITPQEKSELFAQWNKMLFFLVALVGFTIAGIWMWAYHFTNKIAGPIYNISKKLDAFLAGEKNQHVSLRDGDYFHELAEKVNKTLDKASQ